MAAPQMESFRPGGSFFRINSELLKMIDFNSERCLTLVEAAKLIPGRQDQKGLHVSAIYRWVARGVNGVRLETIRIGGRMHTSREALQRFFEASSNDSPCEEPPRQRSGRAEADDAEVLDEIQRTRGVVPDVSQRSPRQ